MTIKEKLVICDLLGASVDCQKKSEVFVENLINEIENLPDNFGQYKKELPNLRYLLTDLSVPF